MQLTNLCQNGALVPTCNDKSMLVLMVAGYQQLRVGDDGDFALNLCCLARNKLAHI
jgi:hypothetical protein